MPLLTDFGSRFDPNVSGTPGSGYGELIKTRSSGLFWPVLYAITHLFWVSLRFERFRKPRGPITWNLSKLAVLAYSRRFCLLLITDFRSRCDPIVSGTPWSGYGELVKNRSFGLFQPVLYAITH